MNGLQRLASEVISRVDGPTMKAGSLRPVNDGTATKIDSGLSGGVL